MEANEYFRRWAAWTLQPDPTRFAGGGANILQRILDGKGELLPGAPRGSGVRRMWSDPAATRVEEFMRELKREDKRLMKVFYLTDYNTHDKADYLGLPTRTMYYRINSLQKRFKRWLTVNCVEE